MKKVFHEKKRMRTERYIKKYIIPEKSHSKFISNNHPSQILIKNEFIILTSVVKNVFLII